MSSRYFKSMLICHSVDYLVFNFSAVMIDSLRLCHQKCPQDSFNFFRFRSSAIMYAALFLLVLNKRYGLLRRGNTKILPLRSALCEARHTRVHFPN
jgi:hypothetical protein